MKTTFNSFINPINLPNSTPQPQMNKVDMSVPNDAFVKSKPTMEAYMEKLNNLFPNNELNEIFDKITQKLGIDIPPNLVFNDINDHVQGGGYTYRTNTVYFSLPDLLDNDHKIVGIKNGKKETLIEPRTKSPAVIDKKFGEEIVKTRKDNFKSRYDDIMLEPMTKEDQRKFILQKLVHELIHAQQHMFMRKTFGNKEVLKAWTHLKPKNPVQVAQLNEITDKEFSKSYWADKPETPRKYNIATSQGMMSHIWLEAVRNYELPPSPNYHKNALEVDAYNRAYQYIVENYGGY